MTELEAFGSVVRRLRKEQKLSQEELAEACGLHRNFIGHIERAEKSPTIETIFKLSEGLQITPSHLVGLAEREAAD